MRLPQRTVKRAIDLVTMETISSDDLLGMGPDAYNQIRRAATAARNENRAHFACEKCGYPVYAPRAPRNRLPLWRHRKGAPITCDWWSGDPSTVDGASARQFNGAQESLLHKELKRIVGELLEIDPAAERGSVIVDQFLVAQDGRRKPDVRAVYDGRPIAIEIQLATTQIPIIMARESFYEREKRGLLWLTWQFEPVIRSRMPTAFEDIFYSHNKNLFSIDRDLIERSRTERRFHVRAYWERESAWQTDIFSLQALTWPESGLPYAVAPPPPWHVDFRNRWLAMRDCPTAGWKDVEFLLNEAGERAGLPWSNHYDFVEEQIPDLVDCLVSLQVKRPVGSRQKNLSELLNTFLATRERHRFARLVWYAMRGAGLAELRQRASIARKLTAAREVNQDDRESPAGKLALAIFPEWFGRPSS